MLELHPQHELQSNYDFVRIVSATLFLADIAVKFAYPFSSKFVSERILEFYTFVIAGRVVFVFGYHFYRTAINSHRLRLKARYGFTPSLKS